MAEVFTVLTQCLERVVLERVFFGFLRVAGMAPPVWVVLAPHLTVRIAGAFTQTARACACAERIATAACSPATFAAVKPRRRSPVALRPAWPSGMRRPARLPSP